MKIKGCGVGCGGGGGGGGGVGGAGAGFPQILAMPPGMPTFSPRQCGPIRERRVTSIP